MLYAYYPPAAIQASGDGEHTTAVNLPSALTDFLATGQADYLYGVGTDTGTAPVTATLSSRTVSFKMKHALAKVSFRIVKSASATEALKLIQVDVLSGTKRLQTGAGTMNLKSGLLNGLSNISTLTLAQASGVELKLKENQERTERDLPRGADGETRNGTLVPAQSMCGRRSCRESVYV